MRCYRGSISLLRVMEIAGIATLALVIAWYVISYITCTPCVPASCNMVMTISIGSGIVACAEREGSIPDPNKWCDILVERGVAKMDSFKCPQSDAIDGESSYAMNKNLAGMRIEDIPNDVVVLFGTDFGKNTWKCPRRTRVSYRERHDKEYGDEKVWKYRWNQCGGPEILTTARHKRHGRFGCHVAYVNQKHHRPVLVRWVSREDVNKLKWKPDENR